MTTEENNPNDDVVSHEVPTHLMAEDTFMFGLTLFNMMMALGVFGAAGAIYFMPFMAFLPSVVRIIIAASVLIIGLPAVLIKMEGRPFTLYMMDMAQYMISPNRYSGGLTSVVAEEPSETVLATVAAREAKAAKKQKGRRLGTRMRATKRAMRLYGPLAMFGIGIKRRRRAPTARQILGPDYDYEGALSSFESEVRGNETQSSTPDDELEKDAL